LKHIGEGSKWLPDPMWFPHDVTNKEKDMKSRVISQDVRSKLSTAIAITAVKDEIAAIRATLIEASELAQPTFEAMLDEIRNASPVMGIFIGVGTVEGNDDDTVDMRYPAHEIIRISTGAYYYENRDAAQLVLDNEVVGSYPKLGLCLSHEHRDKALADIHRRYFELQSLEMRGTEGLLHGYRRDNYLPEAMHDEWQPVFDKLKQANTLTYVMSSNFHSLRGELSDQIEIARTTKVLSEDWPEIVPLLSRIYPDAAGSRPEAPLGNIILRHLTALPAPEAA